MNRSLCRRAATVETSETFEETVLPHLAAARRLARWLVRNEHDADDVVQESSLRAFRYFRTFTGGNGRAWFLTIVRNTCAAWRGPRGQESSDLFDEQQHSSPEAAANPEALLLQGDTVVLVKQAMSRLPARFRQLLVLRELEGLTYQELAAELSIPMGTVMSSLSRARHALRVELDDRRKHFDVPGRSIYETSDRQAGHSDWSG